MLKPLLQPRAAEPKKALTVSELNRQIKRLLDDGLGQLLIEGEISNFLAARSGHWYFVLKDDHAQVKCTMWRGRNQAMKFMPEDGMQVVVRAKASLYEVRGDYQLNIDYLEPAGKGRLQIQFEQLKQKLGEQGLLDPANKKPIPHWPKRVGVITSATGAAIKDVLTVMNRRFPLTEVIIYPSQVQGKNAHLQVIEAINTANQRNEVDVLLITRGGGSVEDLWCFNEEELAYTIAKSKLPTVAAVGHEVDFSIAEFVADQRAATPSAAAELLTPDQNQVGQKLDEQSIQMTKSLARLEQQLRLRVQHARQKLTDPKPLLKVYQKQLEQLSDKLDYRFRAISETRKQKIANLHLRLLKAHPERLIQSISEQQQHLTKRLRFALTTYLKGSEERLSNRSHQLNTVSPLATLARGYSITSTDSNKIIKSTSDIANGDIIVTRVSDGTIESKVKSKTNLEQS